MNLGKNQRHALDFARRFPGWHTYDRRCRSTVSALRRLARRGLVKLSSFHQFTLP